MSPSDWRRDDGRRTVRRPIPRDTGLRADKPEPFPSYYTLHTLRKGRVTGMLSVNAFTVAIWYHWWHGRFRAMEE